MIEVCNGTVVTCLICDTLQLGSRDVANQYLSTV